MNVSICTWCTCCGCFVNIFLSVQIVFQQDVIALVCSWNESSSGPVWNGIHGIFCNIFLKLFLESHTFKYSFLDHFDLLCTWFFGLKGIIATTYFIYSLDFKTWHQVCKGRKPFLGIFERWLYPGTLRYLEINWHKSTF